MVKIKKTDKVDKPSTKIVIEKLGIGIITQNK